MAWLDIQNQEVCPCLWAVPWRPRDDRSKMRSYEHSSVNFLLYWWPPSENDRTVSFCSLCSTIVAYGRRFIASRMFLLSNMSIYLYVLIDLFWTGRFIRVCSVIWLVPGNSLMWTSRIFPSPQSPPLSLPLFVYGYCHQCTSVFSPFCTYFKHFDLKVFHKSFALICW